MSLYREAGRSRKAITLVAGAALLAGLIAGFAVGRATAPEPSLADNLEDLRADLRPVSSALELITIEYPQAVEGREVVAETEYQAAVSQAQQAVAGYAALADELALIAPVRADAVAEQVRLVQDAIEATQPPRIVDGVADEARTGIAGLLGEPSGG